MRIQLGDKTFEAADGHYDRVWKYINSGKWEPQTFRVLDYFVGSEDIVLDLGAWIGAVSLYAAQTASKVYAIEPDPVVFPELKKNIRQNPDLISKIKCCKLAVTAKTGKFIIYARSQYGVSSSSLLPRIRDGLSNIQVDGITFREFLQDEQITKVGFIKIDIEGGEFDLLPAIADELKKINFPTIFVSFHYNYLTEHQYYLKVKCRLISKILMKLEKWTGIELFRKINGPVVLKCLQSLEDYKFIYTESGQELSHALIQSKLSWIKNHNLVYTNKMWVLE